jgi:hypothetical protein
VLLVLSPCGIISAPYSYQLGNRWESWHFHLDADGVKVEAIRLLQLPASHRIFTALIVKDMTGAARYLIRLALQVSRQTTGKRKLPCREWRTPVGQFQSFSSAPWRLEEDSNASKAGNPASPSEEKKASPLKTYHFTLEDLEDNARAEFDRVPPEEQQKWRESLKALSELDHTAPFAEELDAMAPEIAQKAKEIDRAQPLSFPNHRPAKNSVGFWADSEPDDLGNVFDDDDDFQADDMTTPAHGELDHHRDMRAYQRRIAWDMPFLTSTPSPTLTTQIPPKANTLSP